MKKKSLTPKQAAFAMAYVETGNASEAFRQSYPNAVNWKPKTVHERASRLLASDKVQARITELQADLEKRHHITIDSLVMDLKDIHDKALAEGQYQPARQSLMDIAKLLGLVTDKQETKLEMAGEMTPEKAVSILEEMGIQPEVHHAKH